MAIPSGRLLRRPPISICLWLMLLSLFAIGASAANGLPPRNPLDVWIKETPWDPGATNELAAAHGRFYASAGDGGLYVSTDGLRWSRDLNVPGDWRLARAFKQ